MRTSRTNVSPSIHITQTLLLIISSLIWYKFLLYSPQRLPCRWNKLDCFSLMTPPHLHAALVLIESRTGRAAWARQAQWASGRMPKAPRLLSKSSLGIPNTQGPESGSVWQLTLYVAFSKRSYSLAILFFLNLPIFHFIPITKP